MPPAIGGTIAEHFGALDDPRVERTKRHALLDIVTIALLGVVCGADTWVEIEQFGNDKRDWLGTFLALPHGIPSPDTFGRVFAALDPAQFERGFASWVQAIARLTAGEVVAIDGTVLRRSHDRANGKAALALVGAWAGTNRLTLGQVAVGEAANEIVAIPERLRRLALKGCVGTIAAIGCQTTIAAAVVGEGADDVLALKDNQPARHEAVRVLFREGRAGAFADLAHDHHRTVEKDHGRLEVRRVWTVSDPAVIASLDPAGAWPGRRRVGAVEAERRSGGAVSREARYDIGSLAGDAEPFGAAVRGHGGIENGLHWVPDIAVREDESRVRRGHADQNLAVLRRLALNRLRREGTAKVGVKAKRLKAGWSSDDLGRVLAGLAP